MPDTAVLFPGQGSLTVSAAEQARATCPELIERAGALLGEDPFERAAESTRFAQPAIFVSSMAGWFEHAGELTEVTVMAGHSLGELSALAAAEILSVDDALRLVVLRGHAMADAASAVSDGSMVALLGSSLEQAAELADLHGLSVANDNAPGQLVLSGPNDAVQSVTAVARAAGLKAMPLDVAGAFHSPAMAPAVSGFRAAVEATTRRPGRVLVVSGLTAEPFEDVPGQLAQALVSTVRWREVMSHLAAAGARRFVDVGPGRVLARLVARNLAEFDVAVA